MTFRASLQMFFKRGRMHFLPLLDTPCSADMRLCRYCKVYPI